MKSLITLSFALLLSSNVFAQDARPAVGDSVNGEKIFKKSKAKLKVSGNWINKVSTKSALKALKSGKSGFMKVSGKSRLDRADVLAYLRSKNTDIRDLIKDADTVLVSKGTLDQFAEERLVEAKLKVGKSDKKRRVYAFFKLKEGDAPNELRYVSEKNSKARDTLKPSKKSGYVVFMPAKIGGQKFEIGLAVDKDAVIVGVEVRNKKTGEAPEALNKAASRFIGQGARGKYDPLRAPGAGKAMRDIAKPLSDAYLKGVESIYMYEVSERDYFAFDEE